MERGRSDDGGRFLSPVQDGRADRIVADGDRRSAEKRKLLRMEFRTFVNTLIRVPCQIVKTGRRIVYRVLSWNESQPVFRRLAEVLRC